MRFTELLDCHGRDFPPEWARLYSALRDVDDPRRGVAAAEAAVAKWQNRSEEAFRILPDVMLGQVTQRTLGGFCPYGYCAALQHALSRREDPVLRSASEACTAWHGHWWAWSYITESKWAVWLHLPSLLEGRMRTRPSRRSRAASAAADAPCPGAGLSVAARCWYLARPAETCASACGARGLRFSWFVLGQSSPATPFLMERPLLNGLPSRGPLECYVRSEDSLYAASADGFEAGGAPGEWSRPECELACPCEPAQPSLHAGLGSQDNYIAGYRQQLSAALANLLVLPAGLPSSDGGAGGPRRLRMRRVDHVIRFAAFGVHLTTLLEPIFAFRRVLPETLRSTAVFYGTSHPPPQYLMMEVCPDPPGGPPAAFRCYVSSWPPEDAWMKLYDRPKLRDALDKLVEIVENDDYIRQSDCIVCGGGHSPTLCLLLRMVTSTPMYFTLQAPISFRMPQDPDQRALLVALFREMTRPTLAAPSESAQGRTVVTTSLIFFQRQVWVQTGCLLPIVRNHNLYVEAGLAGATPGTEDPKEIIFWQNHVSLKPDCSMTLWRFAKQRVLDDFPFNVVFKNVKRLPGSKSGRKVYALKSQETMMLSFRDLHERFAAAVLFPHDVGTISFDDLYALSIPLFLPETQLVAGMAYAHLRSTHNYPWYLLREEHANLQAARADRDIPLPWDPGWGGSEAVDGSGRETYVGQALGFQQVESAVATANYALFPHVRRFASLAALLRDLSGLQPGELAATARAMRAACAEAWRSTAQLYERAALHLLGQSVTMEG